MSEEKLLRGLHCTPCSVCSFWKKKIEHFPPTFFPNRNNRKVAKIVQRLPVSPLAARPKLDILPGFDLITQTRKATLIQYYELIYRPYLNFTSSPTDVLFLIQDPTLYFVGMFPQSFPNCDSSLTFL